jgi:predicted nucleic acid-binding protein
MKPRYLLDANVVIRFFAQDQAEHLERAKRLVAQAEDGACELILAPWIVAEVVYTLTSFYGADRRQTAEFLRAFVQGAGIVTLDQGIVLDALDRFAAKSVDFADALLAAQAKALKVQPASFDRDLDKFADVKRYEP